MPHFFNPHHSCDEQDCTCDYISLVRHKYIDSFYLCHTYTRIPKHLILDNTNLVILFMTKFFKFGPFPKILHMDNGKEFYNAQFTNLMKQHVVNY